MNFSNNRWSLIGYEPRPQQIDIINEILHAMDQGYKNIILEAGTGIGKSSIATTIANYVDNSYIITMTNQLLQQYLHDFKYMVKEIKGKDNYPCRFSSEDKSKCMIDEVNKKKFDDYNERLSLHEIDPIKYPKPEKPTLDKTCGQKCPFIQALNDAMESNKVITNYDFLYYGGNFANILKERELLILDESHNLEQKIMNLTIKTLNRKTIYQTYKIDIFDGIIEEDMTLEQIKRPNYWIEICNKIMDILSRLQAEYINDLEKNFFKHTIHKTEVDYALFEDMLKEDKIVEKYKKTISKYTELVEVLESEKWIIEVPKKKDILEDKTYRQNKKSKGLVVEFKPLNINEYSNNILHFGETRLFMTGTLGSKDMFCKWIGIDPNETYYIYVKSPFPVENRPILRDYAGKMSGWNKELNEPNWKNDDALLKIHDILEDHKDEKGVIHVSSNDQAWYIVNELKGLCHRYLKVAYGPNREQHIRDFEEDEGNMVLVGAGIKDGVDFKGDKCRFQILFKMPFPSLAGAQVNIRKRYDPTWYIYQTVMPLMQAYGRGIRDVDDYCTTYVLDSDFDSLLGNYSFLFNEYFLEAVEGYVPVRRRVRRRRKPKLEAK